MEQEWADCSQGGVRFGSDGVHQIPTSFSGLIQVHGLMWTCVSDTIAA